MSDPRIVSRPLIHWPGTLRADSQRRPCPFSAGWTDTMELLAREARMLRAREVVIQLAVTESDIRLDGWPYARAQAKHPGVTVVLPESVHGRVSWSTDRYRGGSKMAGWQANVRAIALSMEALRAADRHDVMQGRQYAGFRELGTGAMPMDSGHAMTVEEAARFLAEHTPASFEAVLGGRKPREMAYRFAAKKFHPDTGGEPDLWARLQEAKEVLDSHA